jgi:hypothetical protein
MFPKKRWLRFVLGGAVLALAIGSLLPCWLVWHHGSWESLGIESNLWSALYDMYRPLGPAERVALARWGSGLTFSAANGNVAAFFLLTGAAAGGFIDVVLRAHRASLARESGWQTEHGDHRSRALGYWRRGQALEAGRVVFEHLAPEDRPRWAANVLRTVLAKTGLQIPAIQHVLDLAEQPQEWRAAHSAFSILRGSTLQLAHLRRRSREQRCLLYHLFLAENVAKVIYNATDPRDKFKEDSAWWIAVCLKRLVDAIDRPQFADTAWAALTAHAGSKGL